MSPIWHVARRGQGASPPWDWVRPPELSFAMFRRFLVLIAYAEIAIRQVRMKPPEGSVTDAERRLPASEQY